MLNEKTVRNGKDELSLVFRVNGRRLFMKGANWIPCSAYENEQTPERYAQLIESARRANMNMIRVWGGGQYEKDGLKVLGRGELNRKLTVKAAKFTKTAEEAIKAAGGNAEVL